MIKYDLINYPSHDRLIYVSSGLITKKINGSLLRNTSRVTLICPFHPLSNLPWIPALYHFP
ncbi:hypothetical protein BDV38DRAFT_34256 [Aspergillus pseudotamarii]|uniref:Uncharacterized protein n=1 Tax=Aspergillus pseudotamarii TaxID=132259 RepID=A0A5N6SZ42_ASPPS|nr:uncharacterized protein BDV38DRAFT_34256 [Aspergillus pseudotamarii]KAE8139958.1 hypothetical protein BDV38DRAFT_34256 [Aspergillus pseudotamarii]